jgi:hypothetical protein
MQPLFNVCWGCSNIPAYIAITIFRVTEVEGQCGLIHTYCGSKGVECVHCEGPPPHTHTHKDDWKLLTLGFLLQVLLTVKHWHGNQWLKSNKSRLHPVWKATKLQPSIIAAQSGGLPCRFFSVNKTCSRRMPIQALTCFWITLYIHTLTGTEVRKPGVFTVEDGVWYASDCAATEVKLCVYCNVPLEENDWSASFFDSLSTRYRASVPVICLVGWVPDEVWI